MGWFSKSSIPSTHVEHSKQEDTAAAPTPPAAATTSPTAAAAAAAAAATEEPVAVVEAPLVSPIVVAPLPVMEFDEYKQPEDMYARFQVSDAMNELAACSSLGANIRNYYRYGTFKDCAARYDHLKFCLSIKTKSSQVAQVMIQKRDADLRAQKKSQPNSEDVWTVRSHPPEELVELARQG
ncbi:hypothetical protein BGZ97_009755 [Linnemannia gamsii]|uniref:Uncharacterized protein n=1 Tax=Linnemannia gamsii TaxID=64522 RepID=A0A9P6R9I1_9FUNG|nr:hypothetical protein BGZ97_009755 [Linnemannia gamsii]